MDDMSNIKEMVDDYMERNQEDFEDFLSPDDIYEEILHHLDSLEVPWPPHPVILGSAFPPRDHKALEEYLQSCCVWAFWCVYVSYPSRLDPAMCTVSLACFLVCDPSTSV